MSNKDRKFSFGRSASGDKRNAMKVDSSGNGSHLFAC